MFDHDRKRVAVVGPGGLEALGERELAEEIEYYIPDLLGDQRDRYESRRTMVVGSGYSAVTTLRQLEKLRAEVPETDIVWVLRGEGEPYALIPDDPLPMRRELSEFGNAVARGDVSGIEVAFGPIREVRRDRDDELVVELSGPDHGGEEMRVDNLVANVGYRPDLELFRELQTHECWATEGPIDLAASLLAEDSADCLEQSAGGVERLEHPEPNFYVVGSKSFGRNSTFLLDVGFEQIEQIFESLETSDRR